MLNGRNNLKGVSVVSVDAVAEANIVTSTYPAEFPRAGGLISYGPNIVAAAKQTGLMVSKVLAGTAPADLPIERPSTFELIVNQRTALALGLTIPAIVTARADEVIE